MKVGYLEMELPLVDFLPGHPLAGIAHRVRELFTRDRGHQKKLSYWQIIFLESRANGCSYHGEDLPDSKWGWPKDTWFQQRIHDHSRTFEWDHETAQKMLVHSLKN